MEIVMDNELKLAQVWCSHADQRDEAKQQKLKEFIADCRKEKIFVSTKPKSRRMSRRDFLRKNAANGAGTERK